MLFCLQVSSIQAPIFHHYCIFCVFVITAYLCVQHFMHSALLTRDLVYFTMPPYWTIVNASLSWNVIFTVKGSSVFLSVITCSPIGRLSCFYMDYGTPPIVYKILPETAYNFSNPSPDQLMSQQAHTSSTTSQRYPCPNSLCGKVFSTSDLACLHLAIPDSYCSHWAMDIINRTHGSNGTDSGETFSVVIVWTSGRS